MSTTIPSMEDERALVDSLAYTDAEVGKTPARDDAVLAAYKYLITHKTASRPGLIANVYPLRDGDLDRAEWYDALVSPLLAELPGVKAPEAGTALWRYAGDE